MSRTSRRFVFLLVILFAGGVLAASTIAGRNSARTLEVYSTIQDAGADSAPQQQVAATWALREATYVQMQHDRERNGLLAGIGIVLLGILAVLAFRPDPPAKVAIDWTGYFEAFGQQESGAPGSQ